jgi:hypothetical protein
LPAIKRRYNLRKRSRAQNQSWDGTHGCEPFIGAGFFAAVRPACAAKWIAGFFSRLGAQPKSQVKALVGRLELERYKTTIKGLTQFGGRQQGTDRNGAALVSDADVVTERSIRFVLWNGEESGHVGSRA